MRAYLDPKDAKRASARRWARSNYYENHEEKKEYYKLRQRRINGYKDSPRQLAKAQGKTRYVTGKPCKYGHVAERLVSNGRCIDCMYAWREQYWDKNPDKYYEMLADKNARIQADPRQKLMRNLRIRLRQAIKRGSRGGSAVSDLGCSIEEFMDYIEKQFLPGMTWENWGKETWHLDHKKPLYEFDLTDREQLLEACHFTNFQPLWAADNLRKNRYALA